MGGADGAVIIESAITCRHSNTVRTGRNVCQEVFTVSGAVRYQIGHDTGACWARGRPRPPFVVLSERESVPESTLH